MTPNISTMTTTTKTKPTATPITNTIVIKPIEDVSVDFCSTLSAEYIAPLLQLDNYVLNHLNEIFQNEVFNPYFLMKISMIKQKYTKISKVNQTVFAGFVKTLLDLLEEINVEYFEKIPNLQEYLLCQRNYMKLINKNHDTSGTSTSFEKKLIMDRIDTLRDFHESKDDANTVSKQIQTHIIIPSLLNENHDSMSTNKLFKEFMSENFSRKEINAAHLHQNTDLINEFEQYHQKQIQNGLAGSSKDGLKFFDF